MPLTGLISPANSLVGSTTNDQIGSAGVIGLANGNYVVHSMAWRNSAIIVGAVTWGNNFTALTASPAGTGAATVTFTATDACGNAASI